MSIQQNFDKCIDTMRAASDNVLVSKNDPKGATMSEYTPMWERESRYEGINMDEAEGIVEEFAAKLAEAAEILEGLNDSYLDAYILSRLRDPLGEPNMFGTMPEIVRAHVLSTDD